ncbi:unnamed protein product [Mortierella alpina]
MPRTDESLVNELLNKHSHLLADMGVLPRPPKGSVKKEGFKGFPKLFCDSIVFWGLCNGMDEKSKGTAIGKYIAELRDEFHNSSLEVESIKSVTSGVLYRGCYDYFSEIDRERYRGRSSGIYCDGYVAIKVSLIDCRAKRVVATLSSLLPTLRKRSIVLHDIDFTYDCRYVTMRSYVERHLKDNGIDTVIDDRKRVGDHCVSWMGHVDETKGIRYKVYNKFVQMLESAEKYGYMWRRVSSAIAMTLLANYSFNDCPIYYLEAEVKGDIVAVTREKIYERVPGCTAMTLVAGGQKRMFPSREAQSNGARKFSKVGIVEVDNITIGWPKKKIDRRTPPLADIAEKEIDVGDGYIARLEAVSSSSFTAGYNCLEESTSYTIVAAESKEYRGNVQWHFITECGVRVRAGKSLTKVWNKWRLQFADNGYLEKLSDVEWMSFTAVRKVRLRGIGDIKCELD